jgi:hypothetical protein
MNLSQIAATAGVNAITALANGGTLDILSGTKASSPETALSGNTVLGTFNYSATAFSAPTYASGFITSTASFTSLSVAPTNAGTAVWARAYKADGVTVVFDLTLSAPWIAATTYAVGQYVTNAGNTYICTSPGTSASSGGPNGTGSAITDGTITWQYVGSGIATDGALGNAVVQTGVDITISSQTFAVAAS